MLIIFSLSVLTTRPHCASQILQNVFWVFTSFNLTNGRAMNGLPVY